MSKSLKNSDVVCWKLYSRKLIPLTFQTAKFTKPQTDSTKRIHHRFQTAIPGLKDSENKLLLGLNIEDIQKSPKTNETKIWRYSMIAFFKWYHNALTNHQINQQNIHSPQN